MREHGTLDSRGTFTLSLSNARRKLTHFRTSNRTRYLVNLVQAAVGSGAESVLLKSRGADWKLNWPGAYLPEDHLLGAFARGGQESELPAATDLVLGLQAMLLEGAQSIRISVWHPHKPSYQWVLRAEGEESSVLPPAKETMVIEVDFPDSWKQRLSILPGFGGFVGQPPAVRLLEQLCDKCEVPLIVNGERLNRPLLLPDTPVTARVGIINDPGRTPLIDLSLTDHGWQGLLALVSGPIQLVVRGVSMARLEGVGMSGTVYHQGLALDLSREAVVTNQVYEQFLDQLQDVRMSVLEGLTEKFHEIQVPDDLLVDLLTHGVRRELSEQSLDRLVHWALSRQETNEPTVQSRDLLPGLMASLGHELRIAPRERLERVMIEECVQAFKERSDWLPTMATGTLALLSKNLPSETLVPGYLLLGLGAYYSSRGEDELARNFWMRSLDTVRAGTDDLAEELIHTHMDHPVEHILEQVAIALSLYLEEAAGAIP